MPGEDQRSETERVQEQISSDSRSQDRVSCHSKADKKKKKIVLLNLGLQDSAETRDAAEKPLPPSPSAQSEGVVFIS